MKHHKLRFGFIKNLKVLMCRLFGQRLNNDPSNHWCERCGMAYSECYHPKRYWEESEIMTRKQLMEHGLSFPKNEQELKWFDDAHKDFEYKLDSMDIDVESILKKQ